MIEQHGDSVTVTGQQLLGELYRAALSHIAHRRANGTPSDELRQLAKLLYRAYMSSQRHELVTYANAQSCSRGQDDEFIDSAEAAEMLAVSRRQAQRLAASGGVDLATRRGQTWHYRREAVLALKTTRERKQAAS